MSDSFRAFIVLLYVFMLAPLVVVVVVSFNAGAVSDFPPSGWSLRWYEHALGLDLFVDAIITSFWLGLAAAALSTPLGLLASVGIARGRFFGRDALQAFFLAPLVTPGIVVGIALLASFAAIGLRDAPLRLLLAHVLVTFPFSVRTILASLARVDPALEEAAATLGASPARAFWRVTFPLIQPGIAAGAIFSFVMSFDNIPVSIFLTDVRTNTIPIAIISYLEYNFDPSIAAVSSLLIVGSIALALLLERIFGLRRVMGTQVVATVRLDAVSKRYGTMDALREVSLEIGAGEFVTLLGPSGCGKSTTLRIVAGLTMPDAGLVSIAGEDVTRVPTYKRRIGMVFQNLALFPHLTVAENVEFGLRMRRVAPGREPELVGSALEMVRLSGLAGRYPGQLSGGQQQRVALARAVVFNPDVILLDEPLAALDRNLREAMQQELRELTRRIGITSIFVTHDQEEALILSDRIAVMNDGVIEQVGTPAEVFDAPRTRYVAAFMGTTNLFEAQVLGTEAGRLVLDAHGMRITAAGAAHLEEGARVHVGIRPERIALALREPESAASVEAIVESALFHGTVSTYKLRVPGAGDTGLVVRQINRERDAAAEPLGQGTRVWATWAPESVYVMAK